MVIPSINCPDLQCAQERIRISERFFPFGKGWVHLDVADGKFTFNKTWGEPEEWRRLQTRLNLEVHLMGEEPEHVIDRWLKVGAKRIVVHLETMNDEDFIVSLSREYGASAMLAISPETPVEALRLYFGKFSEFQILAVQPGLPGQSFLPISLDKIHFLREFLPNATIEVDGGVNLETGARCLNSGANILVSASYIFGSENPAQAYNTLSALEQQ